MSNGDEERKMCNAMIEYADQWGECIDRPTFNCVEIRWFDTTTDMEGEHFNQFLATYAGIFEKCGRSGGLIDATQFKMDSSKMSLGWRDEHMIPRYNSAGMKKFAFIMPTGMPAIGSPPTPEGPADFPTGYFGTRSDALAWLTADET